MKRLIKFRGRRLDSPMVYGDLIHYQGYPYIRIKEGGEWEVEPDSVAQFVGYDRNGKEVYEGDVIADDGGEEFIATLVPMMIGYDGRYYIITDEMKLKE